MRAGRHAASSAAARPPLPPLPLPPACFNNSPCVVEWLSLLRAGPGGLQLAPCPNCSRLSNFGPTLPSRAGQSAPCCCRTYRLNAFLFCANCLSSKQALLRPHLIAVHTPCAWHGVQLLCCPSERAACRRLMTAKQRCAPRRSAPHVCSTHTALQEHMRAPQAAHTSGCQTCASNGNTQAEHRQVHAAGRPVAMLVQLNC